MKYILLLFIFISCSTTPTGRKQLLILSNSHMAKLGQDSYREMKSKKALVKDKNTNIYIRCITDHLLLAMGENPKSWEIHVFKDDSPNAFALPGKKMGIHSGMLKVAKTQEQLAAVIGHEIGHVLAHHGNERVSQALLMQGGLVVADISLQQGKTKAKDRQKILAALGLGAQFGLMLPFSRKHESEADELGLIYMAKAGFNPKGAAELWQNMAKLGSNPPEILSTHPAPKTRIKNLQNLAIKYQSAYKNVRNKPNCSERKN